jgi:hypothetical protein
MRRPDDRDLAARLARALDGEPAAEPEVASLAAVLERAVEPARFEIAEEEVERALAAARPRLHRSTRPPRIALAFGAAALAAAAVLAVTLVNLSGVDIESKALAALDRGRAILRLDERIAPARRGTFRPSERMTWFDPSTKRLYSIQLVHSQPLEITLAEPGRVMRYEPQRNLVVTGPGCRALENACPVDPVLFYRRALASPGAARTKQTEVGGRKAYILTLPVQTLPGQVSVEQQVLIDAKTFLPRRIVWLERRGNGAFRPTSVIRITSVEHVSRQSPELAGVFQLALPDGVRVIQRVAPGKPLRLTGMRPLSPAAAARVRPPIRWLGRSFDGRPLRSIAEVSWNAGRAYRLRYRGLTVWNYTGVVPSELVAGRVGAAVKPIPFLHGVARFYSSRTGKLVLELDVGRRSVAVVAPDLYKEQLLRVLQALKPLR